MATLNLTKGEVRLLSNMISERRDRYGLIKNQFSINIKSSMRELNALKKKLKTLEVK